MITKGHLLSVVAILGGDSGGGRYILGGEMGGGGNDPTLGTGDGGKFIHGGDMGGGGKKRGRQIC